MTQEVVIITLRYVLCSVASLPGSLLAKFGYGILGSKIKHRGSKSNAQAN